jgi:hypothetical protein
VSIRCVAVLALAACQGKSQELPPAPVWVRAKNPAGDIVGELRPGRPCRATVGPVELIIGGPPLVAQTGEVRWTGEDRGNGTTLVRDGATVARILTTHELVSVFDPGGIALAKITKDAIFEAGGRKLHTIIPRAGAVAIDDVVVTGTTDPTLAALLVSRELPPEVRMLAACERVLR